MIDDTTLLVLGNGFDLQCKLRSKFSNYFEEKKKMFSDLLNHLFFYKRDRLGESNLIRELLSENSDLYNFWSLALYDHFYRSGNYDVTSIKWFDVEAFIRDSLVGDKLFCGMKLNNVFNNTRKLLDISKDVRMVNHDFNECELFIFLEKPKHTNWSHYFVEELHKFERSFKEYLKDEVASNKNYNSNTKMLLSQLTLSKSAELLNFNYTMIDENYISSQTNVHGTIDDDEIIIGVDSGEIKSAYELRLFTKTYRNMHRLKEVFMLPVDASEIIFFGHSLSKADCSYFYSLFDMYNLSEGSIQLIFKYCDYSEEEEENVRNHNEYVDNIYNLINEYAKDSQVGDNLLHRLLLEGRIIIEKIEGIEE